MQSPLKLSDEEIQHLQSFRTFIPNNKSSVTCKGEPFTFADHCQLAYSIWLRMHKHDDELHRCWCAMMQSNPRQYDIMALVAHHVFTTIENE